MHDAHVEPDDATVGEREQDLVRPDLHRRDRGARGISPEHLVGRAQVADLQRGIAHAIRQTARGVEGDETWVATKDGVLRIAYDAEPPPSSSANLDVGRGVNYGGQRRADLAGDLVCVADRFSGLRIYDVGAAAP